MDHKSIETAVICRRLNDALADEPDVVTRLMTHAQLRRSGGTTCGLELLNQVVGVEITAIVPITDQGRASGHVRQFVPSRELTNQVEDFKRSEPDLLNSEGGD